MEGEVVGKDGKQLGIKCGLRGFLVRELQGFLSEDWAVD